MRNVTVTLVDDLDQTRADETVSFGLDGRDYEIDLSKAHAGELRKMVSRYTVVARRAKTAVRRAPRRTQADRERARQIRAWAVAMGLMTSERGRIPEHVTHEYEATRRAAAAPLRPSAVSDPELALDEGTAARPPVPGNGARARQLRLAAVRVLAMRLAADSPS
jgi:hypothetical protein